MDRRSRRPQEGVSRARQGKTIVLTRHAQENVHEQ